MKQDQSKKIIQLIFAIILIGASIFMLITYFNPKTNELAVELNRPANNTEATSFEKAMKVLESVKFKNLIRFGNWPLLDVGEKGRANPFVKL
jgi:hypothetical protein